MTDPTVSDGTFIVTSDDPSTGYGEDGWVYRLAFDHGVACDYRILDGRTPAVCRLPVDHEGRHMRFAPELVEETGVRVLTFGPGSDV